MELMTRNLQTPPRRGKGAIELIAGILHAIFGKDSFQTALVEWTVVGDKR